MLFASLRGWTQLTATADPERYTAVMSALRRAGLACRMDAAYSGGDARRRWNSFGALTEDPKVAASYRIWVKKRDLDRAAGFLKDKTAKNR